MIDLKSRFSGDKVVRHDESRIQEIQNSVITLSDITAQRVFLSKFPFSAINYSSDDNYRKTGTDPNCESIVELGRGIKSSGLQQSIGLFAPNLSANELCAMASNPDSISPDFWNSEIKVVFGNRRYLAITHHTDITHESVYIYPSEAASFIKDIALIENMDRENVDLVEESVELYRQINDSHSGNVTGFARFSGKPISVLNKIYKIGQAAAVNGEFLQVIQKAESKDVIALEYLAKGVLEADTPHRKKQVKNKLEELLKINGKIEAFRKHAKELSNYAKGESNKLPVFREIGGEKKNHDIDNPAISNDQHNSGLNPGRIIEEGQVSDSDQKANRVKSVNQKQLSHMVSKLIGSLEFISHDEMEDNLVLALHSFKRVLEDKGI